MLKRIRSQVQQIPEANTGSFSSEMELDMTKKIIKTIKLFIPLFIISIMLLKGILLFPPRFIITIIPLNFMVSIHTASSMVLTSYSINSCIIYYHLLNIFNHGLYYCIKNKTFNKYILLYHNITPVSGIRSAL